MRNIILASIILTLPFTLKAQVEDAGLWANVSVEKNFSQAFSGKFNQEFRFNENVSELGTFFSELGFTYKIIPSIGLTANYRYAQKRRLDDSYITRYRYNIDVDYKFEIKKIDIGLRGRFQSQYSEELFTTTEFLIPTNYARGRISIKYKIDKRYKPFITGEVFYQLNNAKGNEIDNMRFAGGFDYELNKFSSLRLYYLYQMEINVKNPLTEYVGGLGYNLSF